MALETASLHMPENRFARYAEGQWAPVFAPRKPGEKRYWLIKSEPDAFSFDDLLKAPRKTTSWEGVRNPVARNFLRDGMKKGDLALFYHSATATPAAVGICEVVREGYPDPTAPDPKWFTVDVRAVEALPRPVTLAEIKKRNELKNMPLVRISRLSVSPVTAKEWSVILAMARA